MSGELSSDLLGNCLQKPCRGTVLSGNCLVPARTFIAHIVIQIRRISRSFFFFFFFFFFSLSTKSYCNLLILGIATTCFHGRIRKISILFYFWRCEYIVILLLNLILFNLIGFLFQILTVSKKYRSFFVFYFLSVLCPLLIVPNKQHSGRKE